jgi:hypothetical protein
LGRLSRAAAASPNRTSSPWNPAPLGSIGYRDTHIGDAQVDPCITPARSGDEHRAIPSCSCVGPARISKDGRELEPEGMTSDVRRWCEARTEPFGQSRVDLDAQPAGQPLGFRKIADVSAEKRCWGVHRVGGGCAAPVSGGEGGVAPGDERRRGGLCRLRAAAARWVEETAASRLAIEEVFTPSVSFARKYLLNFLMVALKVSRFTPC